MTANEQERDLDVVLAEMIEALSLKRDGDVVAATTPAWFGDVLFGGFVIAQAIAAATTWAPEGKRLHSLHAYFLRPVSGATDITFRGGLVREGRSFAAHELRAEQGGKPALMMQSSFTSDSEGYVYDLGGLDPLPPLDESTSEAGPGPWDAAWIGPTEPAADGTRTSTDRKWFRIPAALPDDPHLHAALLGFATDWTGIGGRPLHLEGDTQGMVSLDHSVWFHRPARADDWHFYDVQSLVNSGGRGLLRGVMRDREGRVVASCAQEMLLAVI